jgi:nitrogenase molybdenum-iron protein alpha/beta subunit
MSELFPELDPLEDEAAEGFDLAEGPRVAVGRRVGRRGLARSGPAEAMGVYAELEARLSRPGLAAGSASLVRFEVALGLPGRLRSLKKTQAPAIEFVVELPDGRLAAGALVGPGERAWKHGRSFGLCYRGDELSGLLAKALLRFMARYDGVPFERILDQVVPDPGDEHMLELDYPESVLYAYAPSSGWRRFFEGTELYRGVCGAHTGEVAIVEHTDIECLYNVAPSDTRLPSFFNAPAFGEHLRSTGERPQVAAEVDARHLFTDIRDREVITGADRLLDQTLEALAEDPARPKMVFVHGGCLPDVTGDDLEASVARTRDKLRLPVVVVGTRNDPLAAALGELVGEREFDPQRELEPGSVALLGFPEVTGRAEIDAMLERAGVEVVATALPNFGPDELEGLCRASVLVAYPWSRHLETSRRLSARLAPARAILPPSPYGVAGCCRWLRAVAAASGRGEAMETVIAARLDELRPRWQALRARARRYRVGFIVDHPSWRAVLDPARSVGVPMLPMLLEMGFGVEVLIYVRPGADEPEPEPGLVRVRSYRSCAELDALLAEPGVVAWYSELHYERRLTRKGKNPFSLRQFHMGLDGALRSLRELVELAELPFFRRYHEHLGPAFDELEDPR